MARRTKRRTNRKKKRSINRSVKRDFEKSLRKTIERSIKKSLNKVNKRTGEYKKKKTKRKKIQRGGARSIIEDAEFQELVESVVEDKNKPDTKIASDRLIGAYTSGNMSGDMDQGVSEEWLAKIQRKAGDDRALAEAMGKAFHMGREKVLRRASTGATSAQESLRDRAPPLPSRRGRDGVEGQGGDPEPSYLELPTSLAENRRELNRLRALNLKGQGGRLKAADTARLSRTSSDDDNPPAPPEDGDGAKRRLQESVRKIRDSLTEGGSPVSVPKGATSEEDDELKRILIEDAYNAGQRAKGALLPSINWFKDFRKLKLGGRGEELLSDEGLLSSMIEEYKAGQRDGVEDEQERHRAAQTLPAQRLSEAVLSRASSAPGGGDVVEVVENTGADLGQVGDAESDYGSDDTPPPAPEGRISNRRMQAADAAGLSRTMTVPAPALARSLSLGVPGGDDNGSDDGSDDGCDDGFEDG